MSSTKSKVVTVRFSREGATEGVELDPETVYGVSVDGGPTSEFRSPWTEDELEEHIAILRNTEPDEKPDEERVKEMGRGLAAEVFKIKGIEAALAEPATVYLQLDFPELASLPWELLTQDQAPHHPLLLKGISFIRKVPAAVQDATAMWPTGLAGSLKLLYIWGQKSTPGGSVPADEHLEALETSCERYGISLTTKEVATIEDITALCSDTSYHFVHVLAHGARTDAGMWGLQLSEDRVTGAQLGRALTANGTTPALVTISACDSANDENNTFGSVAYNLHVHGIPLVWASQFRLRKSVSVVSATLLYEKIFGGNSVVEVLEQLRRQLAPSANEAWANEVLYSRYRHASLVELQELAKQQGALRRARAIARAEGGEDGDAIAELQVERDKLTDLVKVLKGHKPWPRAAIAETYGLLGSIDRRISERRGDDAGDIRAAARQYQSGFEADRNSHYCGINMLHLYRRAGDERRAERMTDPVRYTIEAELGLGADIWAHASAGELAVYDELGSKAGDHYAEFVDAVAEEFAGDPDAIVHTLESSLKQLKIVQEHFDGDENQKIRDSAEQAASVLESAIRRQT